MFRYFKIFLITFIFLTLFGISGCGQQPITAERAMSIKLIKYTNYSRRHFWPYLFTAGLSYPPQELAFLIFKNTHQLQVYGRNEGKWKYIKSFTIYGRSGTYGPKLHAGDLQMPEGIYHIVALNPRSHYHLSMQLDYPNQFDRKYAQLEHRTNLGSEIFIHGYKCSAGCIAIGNPGIRQLFPLVYYVGMQNVIVIIAPNDIRNQLPIAGQVHPKWLSELYKQIYMELQKFPVH